MPDIDLKSIFTSSSFKPSEDKTEFFLEHIRPNGAPWSFERREYLRAIIADVSDHIVALKAAQIGATTAFLGELLWIALQGERCGYFLPTTTAINDLVQAQLNPLIDADADVVRSVVEADQTDPTDVTEGMTRRKSADNMRVIHVGRGTAMFRGCQKLINVKQIPLDVVYEDEVAELAGKNDPTIGVSLKAFIPDRIMASKRGWTREFSQPGIPTMDIDESFLRSDQKFFLHRCPQCREWHALESVFPRCLGFRAKGVWRGGEELDGTDGTDGTDWTLWCPTCRNPQSDIRNWQTEWVAKQSGRSISGYHFSQLYGPEMTPRRIGERYLQALRKYSAMAAFQISVLGWPFAGDRQPVTSIPTLSFQMRRDPHEGGRYFAGADTGKNIHYMIGELTAEGVLRVVWAEETEDEKRALATIKRFGASLLIDSMPERRIAKDFCLALKHAAIVQIRGGGARTTLGDEKRGAQRVKTISVDRTEMVDDFMDGILSGEIAWGNRRNKIVETIEEHVKRLVRDPKPDGSYEYRKGVENHFGFAGAMLWLGVANAAALGFPRGISGSGTNALGRIMNSPNNRTDAVELCRMMGDPLPGGVSR